MPKPFKAEGEPSKDTSDPLSHRELPIKDQLEIDEVLRQQFAPEKITRHEFKDASRDQLDLRITKLEHYLEYFNRADILDSENLSDDEISKWKAIKFHTEKDLSEEISKISSGELDEEKLIESLNRELQELYKKREQSMNN